MGPAHTKLFSGGVAAPHAEIPASTGRRLVGLRITTQSDGMVDVASRIAYLRPPYERALDSLLCGAATAAAGGAARGASGLASARR